MSSLRILKYDIRRLVLNKAYIVMLIVTLLYAYSVLRLKVILGTALTAPYSGWSYSAYLCDLGPFLHVIMLFFCTHVFSAQETAVSTLTRSTPISTFKYYWLKGTSVFIAWLVPAATTIAASLVFYSLVFRFHDYGSLVMPILLFLIPPAVFVFGLGMLLGKANRALLHLLIPITFIGGNLVKLSPLFPFGLGAGPDGEIPFVIPWQVTAAMLALLVLGAAMFGMVCLATGRMGAPTLPTSGDASSGA